MRQPHLMQLRANRWLAAIAGALLVTLSGAAPSHAETANPNAYECLGAIAAGKAEAGSEGTAVRYEFHCNGPISGYQLQSQIPLVGLQAAPLVANAQAQPQMETFSCGGETPGYALNCVGSAGAAFDEISGQFYVGSRLCAEPREDPLLTVTYAYLEGGVVTQAISGPFDLGRPLGCPRDAASGGTRLAPLRSPAAAPGGHRRHRVHGKRRGRAAHGRAGRAGARRRKP